MKQTQICYPPVEKSIPNNIYSSLIELKNKLNKLVKVHTSVGLKEAQNGNYFESNLRNGKTFAYKEVLKDIENMLKG